MKTEKFENIKISYMRNVGEYGTKNFELIEKFKQRLKAEKLYNDEMILLGIPLDDPALIPADKLRYDVGLITNGFEVEGLDNRKIDDGTYAIFEVEHSLRGVQNFWDNLGSLTKELPIDFQKPIIERYTLEKIDNHLCEFCVPIAK